MRPRLLALPMPVWAAVVIMFFSAGCSGTAEGTSQPSATAATAQVVEATSAPATPTSTSLRYDGLYISETSDFLRFYEDGTALAVSLGGSPLNGTPDKVAEWFNKDSEWASKGTYSIQGSSLKFAATLSGGTVDYEGTIDGDVLNMNWHSHINDNTGSRVYKWVSTAPLPPSATPPPSPTIASGPGLVLYLAGGDTQFLAEESKGAGQFLFYGSDDRDFKYTLAGDIQGKSYIFDLWLASSATTKFTASIILQQGGKETVLASTDFTIKAKGSQYQEGSAEVSGPDPTTAKGDTLILRISSSSALQGGSIKPGGLAYGGSNASYIKIPPIK